MGTDMIFIHDAASVMWPPPTLTEAATFTAPRTLLEIDSLEAILFAAGAFGAMLVPVDGVL